MTEKLAPQAEKISEVEKTAEYTGGKIDYSVIGGITEHNPLFLIPGFTEGRFATRPFAHTLHEEGDRQVIYPDQPVRYKRSKIKMPILDYHAEGVLAVIRKEGLQDQPVDFIAHSMGSLVFARAVELAKERGLTCFDSDKGSHAIFTAPAGTNSNEGLFKLGGRWLRFVNYEANPVPFLNFYTKQLDPTGAMLKAGQANALADKSKTLREIGPLKKKESMYSRLGELGVRPHILGYPHDFLTPHKTRHEAVSMNTEFIAGYSMPIDTAGPDILADRKNSNSPKGYKKSTFRQFKKMTGLRGEQAKKAWIHHYLGAGHNDRLFHPERTVRAILPILDGDGLDRRRQAEENYKEAQHKRNSKMRKVRITL